MGESSFPSLEELRLSGLERKGEIEDQKKNGNGLTSGKHSVESQGRTLEQLEWVYNQPNPVKASRKVDQVIVQADGTVTEKVVNEPASLGRA